MTLDQIETQLRNRHYVDPDELLWLVADLRRYRAALEWYANARNYDGEFAPWNGPGPDVGSRARAALKGETK